MQDNEAAAEGTSGDQQVGTVARVVLTKFFEALAATDDLADIAINLRKTVLDDGVFAEPAVRTALFPDAP